MGWGMLDSAATTRRLGCRLVVLTTRASTATFGLWNAVSYGCETLQSRRQRVLLSSDAEDYTLSFWTPFEAPSNSTRNGKRVEFDDWAFECESSSVFDGKSRGRHRGGWLGGIYSALLKQASIARSWDSQTDSPDSRLLIWLHFI